VEAPVVSLAFKSAFSLPYINIIMYRYTHIMQQTHHDRGIGVHIPCIIFLYFSHYYCAAAAAAADAHKNDVFYVSARDYIAIIIIMTICFIQLARVFSTTNHGGGKEIAGIHVNVSRRPYKSSNSTLYRLTGMLQN